MAIQNRRGLEADFDPDKMLPGEWAVSIDKKYVRMCFAAGVVVRMATYEAFKTELEEYLTENPPSGLPEITEKDNDKIMQVVDGAWVKVSVADSSVKTYIDEYINSALEGEY